MQSLKDRHVVVTGGTGALGAAVVRAFIEAGAVCHIPAIESTPLDRGIPPLAEEPLLEGQEPAVPPDYDARDYRPAITPAQAGAIAAARRSGQLPSRDEFIAQGNQLPDLRLDLHVYAAAPAERFVFINMRKLREGESLPDGVRVEQITPNGVDLSYQGKRFALAGN